VLDALGNPDALTFVQIVDAAAGDFKDWLADRKHIRIIPHRLEQCGYVKIRNDDEIKGRWLIAGRRQMIYARSTLSRRDQLEAAHELVRSLTRRAAARDRFF
jgi:hypothetical protein